MRPGPVVLCVLDGFGIGDDPAADAIAAAQMPAWRGLLATWPHCRLAASGEAVGLPPGQMGNSEVGHLNLGAGMRVLQDLPRVHRAMPAARLIIAGPAPERIPSYRAGVPGVEFAGFVDDLDVLYRRSRVACAPIQCGGGTRIKIVEAAAYGKPIVATRIGAEGLELRDGHELLLRDDPESFANACLELLEDSSLCARLGLRARAKVEELYNRADIVRLIQGYLKDGNSN